MSAPHDTLCSQCLLPVGRRSMQRRLDGETHEFCCYGCCIAFQVKHGRGEESEAAWLLIRLGVGAFLAMNIMLISIVVYTGTFDGEDAGLLPWVHLLMWALATPAMIILGGPFLRDSWQDAARGQLSPSALIVIGAGAAYAYSVVSMFAGETRVYFDTASMVLLLFTVGRYLEAAGRARAARDLEPLLAAESEIATVLEDGLERPRPVREVTAGALVRVRPGERIPVDGMVIEGASLADEAVITGESRHVAKRVGSEVIAGSINIDGALLIRSSVEGTGTRWARICRSVRAALSHRGPTQRLADRIVALAIPFVLAASGLTVAYWARTLPFDEALLAGLAVLVVACPCAVGLAAPLATSLGIGRLARSGCLVRDPGVLETLASLRAIAFDKTGTLTSHAPQLASIDCNGVAQEQVLMRVAGLERYSPHPLARAVVAAAEAQGLQASLVDNVRARPGRGILGAAVDDLVAAGNASLMSEFGWPLPPALESRASALEESGHTILYAGWKGRVRALLVFDAPPLTEAAAALQALRDRNLLVTLLTGDLEGPARRLASVVGVEELRSGLMPEDKARAIADLRQQHGLVAMVGDGLNDGPVLAAADVGIAVGTATDLARETAALVLPVGGLWVLPWVIDVSRAVRRTIVTNLVWAFGYNLLALSAAALGLLQPIFAAAVMAGSSILVVANSLRLERLADPVPPPVARAAKRDPGTRRHVPIPTAAACRSVERV